MHRQISIACLVMCLVTFALALRADGAPPDPTLADARADFEAGQYQPCLKKISTILTGNFAPAGSPERYELLVLRGECMLQLKNGGFAADAFKSAADIGKRRGDLKNSAVARASAVLIDASPGLRYSPLDGGAPIDIVPAESREKAMRALLERRLTQLKPKIATAMKSKSLLPLEKLLPDLTDAYALDSATSGGKAEETLALASELGGHARELITSELDRMRTRLDQLNDLASEPTFGVAGGAGVVGTRGLNTNERNEIRQMADYLIKIKQVAQEGRRINRSVGGDGQAWDQILADCNEAQDVAQAAFDKRY